MTPFDRFDLEGKTAVVTGGATGLGYHMVRALGQAGATVMIGARRESLLRESAERLMAEPFIEDVRYHPVDLEDNDSIAGFAAHAIRSMGGVDIFFGNAGVVQTELIDDIKPDSMASLLQVHVAANILLSQAFIPGMRAKRWGRIVYSSSVASLIGTPQTGNIVYSAAKGGLNALARSLASDLGRQGITVNTMVFGVFTTELLLGAERHIRKQQGDARADEFMAAFEDVTALGRLGNPEDIEGIVQLIASDAGAYLTGTTMVIDGGMSIMLRPYRRE